ncbi:MAG: type IV pilus modification protein PilV [Dokdonella sp.]
MKSNLPLRTRGFTLLEVLIALVVFSFGMLGLAALQTVSIRTNQSANMRSQAVVLANMALDNMRANRSNLVAYYNDGYASFACTGTPATTPVATRDRQVWLQQLACQLPQARGAIVPLNANEVAVCIRWSDSRWIGGGTATGGSCAADAATFQAGETANGTGSGTDGEFTVFVTTTRF